VVHDLTLADESPHPNPSPVRGRGTRQRAVDLDDLAEAFADASAVMPYFLDRRTGEVILVSDALGFIDAERQRLAMREEPGRYVAIPVAGSGWWLALMEGFLDGVADDNIAARLEPALDAHDPLAAWQRFMGAHPALNAEWQATTAAAQRDRAATWLAALTAEDDDTQPSS
jgi:hypothetical protein